MSQPGDPNTDPGLQGHPSDRAKPVDGFHALRLLVIRLLNATEHIYYFRSEKELLSEVEPAETDDSVPTRLLHIHGTAR